MTTKTHPNLGAIPIQWEFVEVGNVADVTKLAGYEFTKHIKYIEDGEIIALRSLNVVDGQLDLSNIKRIPRYASDALPRSKLIQNDLLLTYTGSKLGDTALIDANNKYHLAPNVCRLRANEYDDAYYLYVFLRSTAFANVLNNFKVGTGQPTVPMKNVRKIPLPWPPKIERLQIGHMYRALNDKIELNRQMNATLESMARVLFKSWFVDFDPVIDNALKAGNPIPEKLQARAELRKALGDQRKPLPENIRRQFPSSFVFSEEMGWVPEGWKINALGDYLKVLETGRRPKGGVAKYASGIPSIGAESIYGIGKFDFGKTKFVPELFFEKMNSGKIDSYDVLLYKDGGKPGEFKPRIGMFGNGFPFDSFGINEHVFRMRSDKLGQPFLYFQAGSARVFHHLVVRGGKAAIPGINQTEVKSIDFLVPSTEILNRFNEFSYSLINRILDGAVEAQSLTKLESK